MNNRRRKSALAAFIFLLAAPLATEAAPCYGTRMPEKHKFFIGAQNYTVFKRYLENDNGKVRSMQDFLTVSYGLWDWLSIDLKGGAGNIKQRPATTDELDYPSGFAGGYGLRLKLYDANKAGLVFGFQHISVHPYSIRIGDTKHKAVLDDWQFSLLASREFARFTPYLGVRWSRMDYIHWIDSDRKRVMSDLTKSTGLILGTDFALNSKSWVNLEANFFDAEALAVSLNFGF